MGSTPDPGVVIDGDSFTGGDFVQPTFDEFQRQTSLMTSCTLLWKELSDHFTSLERDLLKKSESIKRKIEDLDQETKESLDELQNREVTIDKSVAIAVGRIEQSKAAYEKVFGSAGGDVNGGDGEVDDSEDLLMNLNKFCLKMDSSGFWRFITLRKKELDLMRTQIPLALSECMDPARFALEAISEVFPVDKRVENSERLNDLGWACVLVLESLIPVVVDPVIGKSRLLVTPSMKRRAKEIAETWKESLDQRGGIENVKTPDVHTFLQHLVTFGIVKKEDVDLYRKLVVGSAWRKQMPKLAVSLGLGDKMADMIEELIARKQQLDAVHFTYEVGLVHMFPPVPLLKAYLKDAKKATSAISEDRNHSGRVLNLTGRKEQSALRAVIKCVEEYKLEAEFPLEPLKKRLEQLEKVKSAEKRKPVALPANKRTRASNGGGPMMPPAKAGRLTTNAYVSSFPAAPTFARSPSHSHYPTAPSYPYDRSTPPSMYGSLSPQTNPYVYSPEASAPPSMYGSISPQANRYVYSPEAAPPPFAGSYSMAPPPPPMGYPTYGGYGNGMAPAYHHHAYY